MSEKYTVPQLGGTDGFRGQFTDTSGPGQMNFETVAGLSYVLTTLQREHTGNNLVVIGHDTRTFNDVLELAAVSGVQAAGGEPLRMGVAPTPAILRTADQTEAAAAIALTASHNPASDGGWKGTMGADKPYGEDVRRIDEAYWRFVAEGGQIPLVAESHPSKDVGDVWREQYVEDVVTRAITEAYRKDNNPLRPLEGYSLMVDGAYGAAYDAAPKVYEALGARVVRFACHTLQPINKDAGATNLDGAKRYLRDHRDLVDEKFLGVFANDGDGDRFIGLGVRRVLGGLEFEEFSGNHTLEMLAENHPGVVGTVYTNDAAVGRIRSRGSEFEFCRNGDVEVTAALRRKGWKIGGEFTGHTVDLDWLSSGDGILTGARVAARLAAAGDTMFERAKRTPMYPEIMRKIPNPRQIGFMVNDMVEAFGLPPEAEYREVVRRSGTEPVIRVWSTGPDQERVKERADYIVANISALL